MPVALVSTPDLFALTRGGRMLYQFAGSGRLVTQGVRSTAVLFIAAPVTAGTKLVLRWNGVDHTLSFVASPQAPNEFTAGDGSRAYMQSLLAELKTYFPLREAFALTEYDSTQLPGIVLTARQPGPLYDIVPTLPVGTPFGFGTTTAGADPIVRPQYSVYAEIWLQKVGTPGLDPDTDFERIFTPTINCDEEGNAEFNVGKVLHARMQADFPNWSLSGPEIAQYSARKYFVTYGEAYGFPLQIGRVFADQVRYAFWGGTDYLRQVDGGLSMLSYQTADPGDDRALRMGPTVRFVRPDEPQYISFLNSRAEQAGCLLKVTRIFDNAASDDRTAHLDAQTLATGQKVSFAVGPTQLDLLNTLPAGRSLREYTIQRVAADGVTPLSIAYRYILNYDYQAYVRYFGYINSLGALDTLATFGKGSRELARFTEQAEKYLPATYQIQDGQFTDYNVGVQPQFSVTTGFRSQAELEGWTDFYRSSQRFRLTPGKALPIGITSKTIKQAADGDSQFAHSFDYSYLFRDDFYAEDAINPNALPPLGFVGAGGSTITLQPTQTLIASDPTVPDAVRGLTASIINKFQQAFAWGNHANAGYLTQALASLLFRRKDQQISYVTDLTDKPTTVAEAGLTDVPTRADLFNIIHVQAHLISFEGDEVPDELTL